MPYDWWWRSHLLSMKAILMEKFALKAILFQLIKSAIVFCFSGGIRGVFFMVKLIVGVIMFPPGNAHLAFL